VLAELLCSFVPSLRKRPGSSYFVACFTLPDGRPTQRSTKQTLRAKAMAVCLEMARSAKAARASHLTEVQARRVLSDILSATGDTLHIQSIRDYFAHWIDSKGLSKAPGTVCRYQHVVSTFMAHLGAKADRPLSSLIPRDVESFRNAQTAEGKSPTTVNLVVKTLRIPLNLARRQGLILTNPAEAVELQPAMANTRDVFSMEEIQALLVAANTEWRGMVLVGAFAGLRLGDIAKLTVGNIDFDRRALRFSPQKDRRSNHPRELEVPFHPDVERYLLDLPLPENPDASLFPTLSRLRVGGSTGLSAKFRRLMKKAGIVSVPVEEAMRGKGRRFYPLAAHSLRHTFVSMLANRGVHQELRMKLAGHTSDVHQRYSHHDLELLRKNVESLPTLRE
jgi:integrase